MSLWSPPSNIVSLSLHEDISSLHSLHVQYKTFISSLRTCFSLASTSLQPPLLILFFCSSHDHQPYLMPCFPYVKTRSYPIDHYYKSPKTLELRLLFCSWSAAVILTRLFYQVLSIANGWHISLCKKVVARRWSAGIDRWTAKEVCHRWYVMVCEMWHGWEWCATGGILHDGMRQVI